MSQFTSFIVIMFVIVSGSVSSAQGKAHTDVPDQKVNDLFVGEKNNPLEKGKLQVALTPSFSKQSDGNQFDLSLRADYAVVNGFELGGTLPYTYVDPDDDNSHQGIGDIEVSFEVDQKLWGNATDWTLSLRSSFVLPTGDEDRGLGEGRFAWRPMFFASLTKEKWQLDLGIGPEIGDDQNVPVLYSSAFSYELTDKLIGLLEVSGRTGTSDDPIECYVVPGAYWKLSDTIDVGLGVPIGVTDDSDDYRVVGKFIMEF